MSRSACRKALARAVAPIFEALEGRRLLSGEGFHGFAHPACASYPDLEGTTFEYGCESEPMTNLVVDCPTGPGSNEGGDDSGDPSNPSDYGGDNGQGYGHCGFGGGHDGDSGAPVRYFDGMAIIGTSDVTTDASGQYWGYTRSWRGGVSTSHNGNGWYVMDLPRLEWHSLTHTTDELTDTLIRAEGVIQAVDSGGNRRYFDYDYDGTTVTITARDYATSIMTQDSDGGEDELVLRDENGGETRYRMLEFPTGGVEGPASGQFKKYTAPGGTVVEATWSTTSGQEGELTQVTVKNPDNTHLERFVYTYTTVTDAGSNSVRRISSLEHKVGDGSTGFTTERSVTYSYYTGDESGGHGRLGDLKLAQIRDGGTSATVIDSKYYRYYEPEADYTQLKSVFEGESFDRMVAAYSSYESATDAQLEPYVDHYFEYEKWSSGAPYGLDNLYRVTKEIARGDGCSACSGGQGEYKFEYATNSNVVTGLDYDTIERNTWRVRTTEYLPDTTDSDWTDNDRKVVYTNEMGQVLMEVYKEYEGSTLVNTFYTAFRYDDDGRLIMRAEPSAVTGLDETEPDLIGYDSGTADDVSTTAGRVWLLDWYDGSGGSGDNNATDSAAGGALGYLQAIDLARGLDGNTSNDVPMLELKYKRKTLVNGKTSVLVAEKTRWRDEAGTQAITTTFDFTWYSSSVQVKSRTQNLQEATTGQNGPGSSAGETITTWYDEQGRPTWVRDEGGYVHYTGYDVVTGAVVLTVTDANLTTTDSIITSALDDLDLDSETTSSTLGVTRTASGTALQIETRAKVDRLGRTVKTTDPNGNVTWTVYNDVDYEMRVYPGWNATTGTTTGPIRIMRTERGGTPDGDGHGRVFTETMTLSATPTTSGSSGSYVPTGAETISASDIESLHRSVTNDAGQVVEELAYFNVSGLTYSATNAWIGTASNDSSTGNYHLTEYKTNGRGWVERVLDATGTITRQVLDGLGRVVSTWVGTDDTPTSGFWSPTNTAGTDLVKLASFEYDKGLAGDGNLTKLIQHVDATSGNDRVTLYDYDWRNRLMLTRRGVTFSGSNATPIEYLYTTYDSLDRPITSERFHGSTGLTTWSFSSGVPASPSSGDRTHKSATSFDDRGRAWRSETFSVNTSSGAVGSSLKTDRWFDGRGNPIKTSSPGGLVTKRTFDGAGRQTATYFTDGGSDSAYADADDVTGDTVLEERHTEYDDAGNVVLITSKLRFHNASGTGALGDPSTSPTARRSYQALYYDAANRLTEQVDVGTNGGSTYTRPGSAPSRSDTVLVTSQIYDDAGNPWKSTDPRGIETRSEYDDLGRRIKLTEAHVDGTPSDADDRITRWTFNGLGQLLSLTADLPSGQTDQTTTYSYAATTGRGDGLTANNVLISTTYPDPGGSVQRTESYKTNRAGQRTSWTDRNGTVHDYTYDLLGRLTLDDVTTLGSGVDGTVRKLATSYNDQGLVHQLTSKDGSSTTLNQIQRTYNDLGQLTEEEQEHDGAVDGSTLSVQYAHSEMASGANHSRLTSMTYPDGTVLAFAYTSGLESNISRLSKLTWDSTDVETYSYLGLSTVVVRDRPEGDHTLTYVTQAGEEEAEDPYTGLDRFGRVLDHRWALDAGGHADRFTYGYDRSGNVLWKKNELSGTHSELYMADGADEQAAYDKLNRLVEFQRGTLSDAVGSDGYYDTVSTSSRKQVWDLDALGNWDSLTNDGGSAQTRTHDAQNRITAVSGATSPTHSANGEMTGDETGQTLKYDAWGRIVEINTDGTGAVEITYAYDALHRRIDQDGQHLYYSDGWQVLEERNSASAAYATHQYVWSPVYVDAMVLRDRDANASNDGMLEERLYVTHDANFNVTALVDTGGVVQERFIYDPYGTRSVLDANWAADANSLSDYTFLHGHQGGRHDLDAGLVHFRLRDLDTSLGRWVRRDPLSFIDGASHFQSRRSNPARFIDPLGLRSTHPLAQQSTQATTSVAPDCCDQLRKRLGPGTAGSIACCNGEPRICLWVDEEFPSLPFDARLLIMGCVRLHEMYHLAVDTAQGGCRDECGNPIREGYNPRQVDHPLDEEYVNFAECRAYFVEIMCLTVAVQSCKTNECLIAVGNRIARLIELAKNDHCKSRHPWIPPLVFPPTR